MKKYMPYADLTRSLKRVKRSICIVGGMLMIFIISMVAKKVFLEISPLTRDKMLNRCMDFINAEMDRILQHKTRDKQNMEFRAIRTNLPIKPVRMSTTTAVFKYMSGSTPVVLKRIIWNSKNTLNEDEMCTKLKGRNKFLVNALMSTRSTRIVPSKKEPGKTENQTLIWIFFEYMDVKINERHVKGEENVIRTIIRDALKGLQFLHSNNLAHLDIKIANIMGHTQKNGEIIYKLIDFGYTQHFYKGHGTIPGKNYGTFPFKAPEVIQKNLHGTKSDIWALGATAWYLSLSNIPFYDSQGDKDMSEYHKFINTPSPRGNSKRNHQFVFKAESSPELKNFVKTCMKIDYAQRPTAKELLNHPFIKNEKLDYYYEDSRDEIDYSTTTSSSDSF
ncbi:hypothetical protein NUSPORA_02459 [Nucleospora cyclopteri]